MTEFFVQGLWHPLLMPAHLVVLIALGLLAGQQGTPHLKTVLIGLFAALVTGTSLTLVTRFKLEYELILLVLAMVAGVLVVLRLNLPRWPLLVLAILAGLCIGLESAAPRIPGLRGTKVYALLAGTVLSSSVLALLVGLVSSLLRHWLEGIALRVLGAWITAGALLVLALNLNKSFGL